MTVETAVIPSEREVVIVVGTSVRKPLAVLQPHLESLAWQILPPRVRLVPAYVLDYLSDCPEKQVVTNWATERGGTILRGVPPQAGDFSDTAPVTHQWSVSAMRRVGENKNRIMAYAASIRADYVWFCDTDLICDRTTLWSLYHAQTHAPITCAVYWTRWANTSPPSPAAPQVWLRHPYELSGRGMEEAGFRQSLLQRDLTPVWGQGACSLIARSVWEAGVTFSPAEGVPQEGLMAGEDRQFCIHAERRHIPMLADPWPDIYHIYQIPHDTVRVPEFLGRLGTADEGNPRFGDLVSLHLQPLEPYPQPNGTVIHVGPQAARGRLGVLPLLPDLETAVYEMKRGDVRIVKAKIPMHFEIPQVRGQVRLFRVTLIDHKPFMYPPVLEDDLRVR